MPDLEQRFHGEMVNIYGRVLHEANYRATRFLQMVVEQGGLQAATALLHAPGLSEGFVALWKRGRLDLTMEALILHKPWSVLFNEAELTIARERLERSGYKEGQLI